MSVNCLKPAYILTRLSRCLQIDHDALGLQNCCAATLSSVTFVTLSFVTFVNTGGVHVV